MGIKECNRNGCECILCDDYSSIVGYICTSCLTELEATELKCVADVRAFMSTLKTDELDKDFSVAKLFGET